MRICAQCVNVTTRPNINFSEKGLCPVCVHYNERKAGAIDWSKRKEQLAEIAAWGIENSNSSFDCIVGVSGGKDSTRQAFYIRDELNMKPLLISLMYPPEQMRDRGAANISNLISHGFDIQTISCNPIVWKQMMKRAFLEFGNWCKATEYALYSSAVHFSIAFQIPLIFLGENPAYTIGERHGSDDGDATSMRNCNTLQGGVLPDSLTEGINPKDLYLHTYPSEEDVVMAKTRIAYLGYYVEDFNCIKNKDFAVENGLTLRTEPPEETGDITNSQSLDEDFYPVNQFFKFIKLGFGQVTDKAGEMINLGALTREEGLELVKLYDGKCHDRYIKAFCDYLQISREEFDEVVERYRNKDLFTKRDNEWVLNYDVQSLAENVNE